MQAQKLLKMQKPTALAIKEQVSVEVDENLLQSLPRKFLPQRKATATNIDLVWHK